VRWKFLFTSFSMMVKSAQTAQSPQAEVVLKDIAWGSSGKDGAFLQVRRLLAKTEEADRKLLLHMAQKMLGKEWSSRKQLKLDCLGWMAIAARNWSERLKPHRSGAARGERWTCVARSCNSTD